MDHLTRYVRSIGSALVAILIIGGCSESGEDEVAGLSRVPDEAGASFFAQSEPATVVMDALYEGRIFLDRAGCLRLETRDEHTVVWPFGFSLEKRATELVVVADDGRVVGRIGGHFTFGGGEVPFLHEGIPLSAEDRARAEERCPGRYWIVGEVP